METTFDKLPVEVRKVFPTDEHAVIVQSNHLGPGCGWNITLGNGWEVSVQCGYGTYSSNHDALFTVNFETGDLSPDDGRAFWLDGATTAEVAVIAPRSETLYRMPAWDGDVVCGYQDMEDVLALLAEVASYPA